MPRTAPTEIFAAKRYRADASTATGSCSLTYVGAPARMTATLLANPFSAKAAGKFRPVVRGSVVYECD